MIFRREPTRYLGDLIYPPGGLRFMGSIVSVKNTGGGNIFTMNGERETKNRISLEHWKPYKI